MLTALGLPVDGPDMAETPRRLVDAYAELLAVPDFDLTTFDNGSGYDELVLVRDIPVRSLCEHHLLPFTGVAHVGYLPGDRILGLSKLARTVEFFARRVQTQERLTSQVADHLHDRLAPARRRRGDRGRAQLHERPRRARHRLQHPHLRAPRPAPRRPRVARRVPQPDPRQEFPMSAPIVVVGGGLAAGTFVTQLRERGHDGDVVLLAEETHAPYERPPLSKDLLLGKGSPDDAAVHEAAWYAEHGIDLRTGTAATAIDPAGRRVQAGGDWLDYDELVLATGARAAPPADGRRVRRAGRLPAHPRRLAGAPRAAHRREPGSASSAAAGSGSRSPRPPASTAPR